MLTYSNLMKIWCHQFRLIHFRYKFITSIIFDAILSQLLLIAVFRDASTSIKFRTDCQSIDLWYVCNALLFLIYLYEYIQLV